MVTHTPDPTVTQIQKRRSLSRHTPSEGHLETQRHYADMHGHVDVYKKMVALRHKMPINTCKSRRTQVAARRWPLGLHIPGSGGGKVKTLTLLSPTQVEPRPQRCLEAQASRTPFPSWSSWKEVQDPQICASRAEERDKANKMAGLPEGWR